MCQMPAHVLVHLRTHREIQSSAAHKGGSGSDFYFGRKALFGRRTWNVTFWGYRNVALNLKCSAAASLHTEQLRAGRGEIRAEKNSWHFHLVKREHEACEGCRRARWGEEHARRRRVSLCVLHSLSLMAWSALVMQLRGLSLSLSLSPAC